MAQVATEAENDFVARISVAVLLAVGACDQGASTRLYADDEVAAIREKAAPRTSQQPDSLMDVTMLSLGGLMKELEDIRKEPNASLAASRAVDQVAGVRQLGEGEQNLVRMFVVQSGETAIADVLDEILRRGGLLPADLDALAGAIDRLIATEPRVGTAFEGSMRWLRGSLLHSKYSIPASGGHDIRDEVPLTLAALEEIEPLLVAACPPSASLSTCHHRLPARTKNLRLAGWFIDDVADQIGASDPSQKRRLQSELTHKVALNQLGGYPFYVERAATDVSRLVALRVQIELVRAKTCNVPIDLLSPKVFGEPVTLTTLGDSLRIEPPAWAKTGIRSIESWTIACPRS